MLMAINTSKALVGGLAAGVVANIIGFVLFGMLLGPRFEAEAVAVAPVLQGRGMTGTAIAINVIAALAVWVCGFVFHLDWLLVGLMTPATYMLASIAAFIQVIAAAAVGGMLYR